MAVADGCPVPPTVIIVEIISLLSLFKEVLV